MRKLHVHVAIAFLLLDSPIWAAHLNTEAKRAFDRYVATFQSSPAVADLELKSGAVLVEPVNGGSWDVGGALLHHWRGVAFVPGATRQDVLRVLGDYNHLSRYYAPEILSSQTLRNAGGFTTVAMRIRKQKVVTVVLDAEYEIEAGFVGENGGYSRSRSTHIWQISNAGTSREQRLAEGEDDGFLWRLNAYWSVLQGPDGVFMACEAVSLTRDIPAGLGWLIQPIAKELPRESLAFTLNATRKAVLQQ